MIRQGRSEEMEAKRRSRQPHKDVAHSTPGGGNSLQKCPDRAANTEGQVEGSGGEGELCRRWSPSFRDRSPEVTVRRV